MNLSIPIILALPLTLSVQGATVYFSVINDSNFGGNDINSVDGDGSNFANLYNDLGMPLGMAYDKVRDRIYWADGYDTTFATNRPSIRSSAPDGSGTALVQELPNYPGPTVPIINHLTYDQASDQIYWSDVDTTLGGGPGFQIRGYVGQVGANGAGAAPAFTYNWAGGTIPGSTSMPVAAGLGSLYHTGSQGRIFANGNVAAPIIQRDNGVTFEAMELYESGAGSKLFWIENQTLYSAFTDGTGVTALIAGIINGGDLDFDYGEGKVYWSDDRLSQDSTSQIRRANLDGSGEEIVHSIGGGSWIVGIAVVPEPSSALLFACGGLWIFARRRG